MEKEKRNITFEYLAVPDFYIDEEIKSINEEGVVDAIRAINPQITIMVICYSQILDLKFLLEEKGVFTELRVNRDLNILSRGQILTMSQVQKDFIEKMSLKENIEKDVVISGPVGSGKTTLGLEVINMKKSHYKKKNGLSAHEYETKFRVIFGICANHDNILAKQLLAEKKSLSADSSFEVCIFCHSCHDGKNLHKIGHPDSYVPYQEKLQEFVCSKNFHSNSHTFIMLDEVWSR